MMNRAKNFLLKTRKTMYKKKTNREEKGKYRKEEKRIIPIRKGTKSSTALISGSL
jgi:hypothetical protein